MSGAKSCWGCVHYLGGGCCRINVEAECRDGGGFELYEIPEEIRQRQEMDGQGADK